MWLPSRPQNCWVSDKILDITSEKKEKKKAFAQDIFNILETLEVHWKSTGIQWI